MKNARNIGLLAAGFAMLLPALTFAGDVPVPAKILRDSYANEKFDSAKFDHAGQKWIEGKCAIHDPRTDQYMDSLGMPNDRDTLCARTKKGAAVILYLNELGDLQWLRQAVAAGSRVHSKFPELSDSGLPHLREQLRAQTDNVQNYEQLLTSRQWAHADPASGQLSLQATKKDFKYVTSMGRREYVRGLALMNFRFRAIIAVAALVFTPKPGGCLIEAPRPIPLRIEPMSTPVRMSASALDAQPLGIDAAVSDVAFAAPSADAVAPVALEFATSPDRKGLSESGRARAPEIAAARRETTQSNRGRATSTPRIDFDGESSLSRERPDPAVQPSFPTGLDVKDKPYPRMRYARFPGTPFLRALSWDQVIQGRVGTCFFLTTLVALAEARPRLLKDSILDHGDGTYTVKFYDGAGRRVAVSVDDRFPTGWSGRPFFARGRRRDDIRAALFEKAYAKLRGGYKAVDGGFAKHAFAALTGGRSRAYPLARLTDETAWKLLRGAVAAKRPIVAGTNGYGTLKKLTRREDLDGMIYDHDYAVLGVSETNRGRFVRVYTSLSPRDASPLVKDRRRIRNIPLAEFRQLFESMTVALL